MSSAVMLICVHMYQTVLPAAVVTVVAAVRHELMMQQPYCITSLL
jgi:hypothetical protein